MSLPAKTVFDESIRLCRLAIDSRRIHEASELGAKTKLCGVLYYARRFFEDENPLETQTSLLIQLLDLVDAYETGSPDNSLDVVFSVLISLGPILSISSDPKCPPEAVKALARIKRPDRSILDLWIRVVGAYLMSVQRHAVRVEHRKQQTDRFFNRLIEALKKQFP